MGYGHYDVIDMCTHVLMYTCFDIHKFSICAFGAGGIFYCIFDRYQPRDRAKSWTSDS